MTTATLPDEVLPMLGALGTIYNNPKTGAQGSGRMVPTEVWPWKVASDHGYAMTKAYRDWTNQEKLWRGLPDGVPQEFATYPDGELILNGSGQPIVPNVWDGQHLTLRQYIDIWRVYHDPLTMRMASAVLKQVIATYTPQHLAGVTNQRELAHILQAYADWYEAVDDDRVLVPANNVIKHLASQMHSLNGVPYVTLNANGWNQADHGYCRVTTWMTTRIGQALQAWHKLTGLNANGQAVLAQVYDCIRYAHACAPGSFVAVDYDPGGNPAISEGAPYFHDEPTNAMRKWLLRTMCDASAPEDLRTLGRQWYSEQDWSRTSDKNYDEAHNFSINLWMTENP